MVRYVYVTIRELNSTLSTSPSDLFAGRYHHQLHIVRNEPLPARSPRWRRRITVDGAHHCPPSK